MKIRIGYRDFTVVPFPAGFGERLDGDTDFSTLTFHVQDGLAPQVKSATILHEVLHVIYDEYALSESDKEERIVSAFTNGMCQVMRDNPDVMAQLLMGLRK